MITKVWDVQYKQKDVLSITYFSIFSKSYFGLPLSAIMDIKSYADYVKCDFIKIRRLIYDKKIGFVSLLLFDSLPSASAAPDHTDLEFGSGKI